MFRHNTDTYAYDESIDPEGPDDDAADTSPVRDEDSDQSDQLPRGSDPRRAVPSPRMPGFTGTVTDWAKALAVFVEQVRMERPTWTDAAINREAEWRYEQALVYKHPLLAEQYAMLMQESWCPNRRYVRDNIEAKACRQVPEWQQLEATLTAAGRGRPSDRRLQMAVFARQTLSPGVPDLRANVKAFEGSDLELDWAFFDSFDMLQNRELMRDETAVRRVMKGMLERSDADQTIALNLAVIKRIADRHKHIGRYLVIDGTEIQAPVEQCTLRGPEHAALVTRETGAQAHFHGGQIAGTQRRRQPKYWVGWKLLVISDMKSGLPLIWKLITGEESQHTVALLERLLRLAPWMDPEFLTGDKEFDKSTRLALDLQSRFGIAPAFPLRRGTSARFPWVETKGVPHCSQHGVMKLKQSDDFESDHVPLAHEPNRARASKGLKARSRWVCEHCEVTETTWFRNNPRLYTFLPHMGNHRRVAVRYALLLRRNSIEAVFSQLKRRGIGNKEKFSCRWISRQTHVEWLCGAALLAMTVRREAHETGLYAQCAEEAWDLGLTKVQPKVPAVAGA